MDPRYDDMDATAMAAQVRSGQVAPEAFVQEARLRMRRVNHLTNAVVHDLVDASGSGTTGLLAGVPLPLKNIGLEVAHAPMTLGSRLYQDHVGTQDSTLAARYRAAGAVFVARSNTPELALSFTGESALHGPCRNPWDLTRSAGGSSAGAAALVASGCVPLAQSSDGAGSTRVPAAHCGLVGLKTSRLRNPLGPQVAESVAGMSTPHGLARHVRDLALLLDAGQGPDQGDPWGAPPGPDSFLAALSAPLRPLHIGLHLPQDLALADPCREATLAAADLLRRLGHRVSEAAPDYDNAALKAAWRCVAGVGCAQSVALRGQKLGLARPEDLLEPVNAEWIAEGRATAATTYLAAVQTLHATSRAMGRFFAGYDIYLSPTTAELAPKLGWLCGQGMTLDRFYDRFWAHAPLTAVFNASGCPAISVPLGWTAEGLPVGVQFGAAFGAEALLLQLAQQLESAAPWAGRRPPVHAGGEVPA